MHPKLDWPEHPRSKFEKKAYETCIQNGQAHPEVWFFCGKKEYTSELLCVCVCKGCKRMPVVTVMTEGLHACLW